jgi:integrase
MIGAFCHPTHPGTGGSGPWYIEPIIVMDVNTGLRRRKILYLRWGSGRFQEADHSHREPHEERAPTQPAPKRYALLKLNEVHLRTGSQPYVFVHLEGKFEGQPITDIKNAFNGAVDRAKIKDFQFHDLRHTFCSWLAIRGVPLTAIQKLSGHASIKMTLRYAHLVPGI